MATARITNASHPKIAFLRLAADQRPARAANVFVDMNRRMRPGRRRWNAAHTCLGGGGSHTVGLRSDWTGGTVPSVQSRHAIQRRAHGLRRMRGEEALD